ncbi:type II secretion system protein [Ramlibacter sp. AW1]|uniref:Type II secretion system protein n=1 Tax=Ramlibacter aurantiacus TaxID=2801330 RepID=A0A936ZMS9_9BURK|nr:type II secretion system protein [Ramlibacter aurantiacus]MBL0420160.1 type II secretion system protein [Ramlibacter aurantiacus]
MPTGRRRPARSQHGFTYLALLIALAVIGLWATQSLEMGASAARRNAERELLAIGGDFERALRSYANLPPERGAGAGVPTPGARGPRELQDLLRDPRVPGIRRHLRRVPHDPLTGRAEWGLVRDEAGFIVGVHSLASGRPIRQVKVEGASALSTSQLADSYADWVFGLGHRVAQANRPAAGESRKAK